MARIRRHHRKPLNGCKCSLLNILDGGLTANFSSFSEPFCKELAVTNLVDPLLNILDGGLTANFSSFSEPIFKESAVSNLVDPEVLKKKNAAVANVPRRSPRRRHH